MTFAKSAHSSPYAPTDNVSELTARINDEGWDTSFSEWLKGSRLSSADAVLVFSVGGGNREKNVSVNLVRALEHAETVKARIFGIVGKDGGFTAQSGRGLRDHSRPRRPIGSRPTPRGRLCAVVWHLIVSHPALKRSVTKWESTK